MRTNEHDEPILETDVEVHVHIQENWSREDIHADEESIAERDGKWSVEVLVNGEGQIAFWIEAESEEELRRMIETAQVELS